MDRKANVTMLLIVAVLAMGVLLMIGMQSSASGSPVVMPMKPIQIQSEKSQAIAISIPEQPKSAPLIQQPIAVGKSTSSKDDSYVAIPKSQIPAPMPSKAQAKTEAEWCIFLNKEINDRCRADCQREKAECTSSADYCGRGYYYCNSGCGDFFTLRVDNCLKGTGILFR